jgi:AcrR family transcriptional regulator
MKVEPQPTLMYPEPAHRPAVEAARRAQILAAARACIGARGYDATTIRDVAAASGVSTGTINYYFAGKEALLVAALEDLAGDLAKSLRQAAQHSHDDALAALVAIIEASLPEQGEAPHNWYIWMEFWGQAARHPALRHTHAELYKGWRRLIARVIADGIASGQFHPVDPETTARQLAGLLDGLAIHSIVGDPEIPPAEVRRLCIEFLHTTLLPHREVR